MCCYLFLSPCPPYPTLSIPIAFFGAFQFYFTVFWNVIYVAIKEKSRETGKTKKALLPKLASYRSFSMQCVACSMRIRGEKMKSALQTNWQRSNQKAQKWFAFYCVRVDCMAQPIQNLPRWNNCNFVYCYTEDRVVSNTHLIDSKER